MTTVVSMPMTVDIPMMTVLTVLADWLNISHELQFGLQLPPSLGSKKKSSRQTRVDNTTLSLLSLVLIVLVIGRIWHELYMMCIIIIILLDIWSVETKRIIEKLLDCAHTISVEVVFCWSSSSSNGEGWSSPLSGYKHRLKLSYSFLVQLTV